MKKLLVLFTFIMMVFMGACASAPNDTVTLQNDVNDLQYEIEQLVNGFADEDGEYVIDGYYTRTLGERIDELEQEIAALNERLDNITRIDGLNGNVSFYENEALTETEAQLQFLSATIVQLKDTFDKSKAPSYMLDDNGEYVNQETLGIALKEKYYNDVTNGREAIGFDRYDMGMTSLYVFVFDTSLTTEELIARTVLLVEELRLYEFYALSCPQLQVTLYFTQGMYTHSLTIKIPLVVVINGMFTINLDGVISGDYEMQFDIDIPYDITTAQTYYDDYVTNETFIGYVLNYE